MPRARAGRPRTKNGTSAPFFRREPQELPAIFLELKQAIQSDQHRRRVAAAAAEPRAGRDALLYTDRDGIFRGVFTQQQRGSLVGEIFLARGNLRIVARNA